MNLEEIRKVVEAVADPVCGKSLADLKAVQSMTEKDGTVAVHVTPGYPVKSTAAKIEAAVKAALAAAGIEKAEVTVTGEIRAHRVQLC